MDRNRQFIYDLKSSIYCCRKIIEINMELEEMNHQILGISHNAPRLTRDQERNPLPMPTYSHTYTSPLALLEEITMKENEIEYYRRRINDCSIIEFLSITDQNILFDLYFHRINAYEVSRKYGYTRQGLYKHIYSELNKFI